MSRSEGSVRIGPVSLFTLVIVLCLAVLAVLAATTAQATYASAEKQARFTQDTYANEQKAQATVAALDAALAPVRNAGGGLEEALAAVDRALPPNAVRDGATVKAEFVAGSGRTLAIEVDIQPDATYAVTSWKATTQWTDDNAGKTLWSGVAQKR